MRRLGFVIAALCLLVSCERGKVLEVAGCAAGDEKISVAFTDPRAAVNYLGKLSDGLKARDSKAIDDTVDLLERLISCVDS
jgi:hypothetical protein